MAAKIMYQIVGRYMDGTEVTGYHLQSMDRGKSGRYTREQVAYLVGRDQVTNCSGQIYKDKLLLRGVGISLDDLPVQQENGVLSRTENIGKVRKGVSAADAMTQVMIVKCVIDGKNTLGYIVQNAGGQTKYVDRATLLEMAREGKIGNARVQDYNGKVLLRGIDCNLNQLPIVKAEELGLKVPKQEDEVAPAVSASVSAAPVSAAPKVEVNNAKTAVRSQNKQTKKEDGQKLDKLFSSLNPDIYSKMGKERVETFEKIFTAYFEDLKAQNSKLNAALEFDTIDGIIRRVDMNITAPRELLVYCEMLRIKPGKPAILELHIESGTGDCKEKSYSSDENGYKTLTKYLTSALKHYGIIR